MRVTKENVHELIEQGLLPEGDLIFHIRSGAEALPLPSLFKTRVRWVAETEQHGAIVTKQSESYPPFTFFEWNQLDVEEQPDEDGVVLRFTVRSIDMSTPVEILVVREHARQV
ncbi:MAG: hypothetical protein IPO81_29880 [Kouleothrix sp.]|nr:hypothetical protein [Kouleothrix sp.]